MRPDLRLAREPGLLPISFESLHAAALGGRLHVVGLDEARHARHLAVDGTGQAAGAAAELPLVEVTGLLACGDSLVVTGVTRDDRPAVLRVQPDGQVAWRAELPAGGRLQHWPRPACAEGTTWLLSTTSGRDPGLHLTEAAGDRLGAPISFALADDSDGLDILGEAASLLVARVHGEGRGLELLRIASGRVVARFDVDAVRPTAPSLARAAGRTALAWVSRPGEARLQWFDAGLMPLGAPEALATPPSAGLERVQLLANGGEALIVLSRSEEVVDDGQRIHQADGTILRREPRRARPLWIAAYDRQAHELGPPHRVDADAKLHAGDWLDGAAAVVHRGDETRVSIFVTMERGV